VVIDARRQAAKLRVILQIRQQTLVCKIDRMGILPVFVDDFHEAIQNSVVNALGAGGATGGFNPLYQVGGPRSIQFALKLQF
jgi:hypothetical protein